MAASSSSDIKVIGTWPSPFVNRVQIALNLKSLKFEFLQEVFGEKSELLLKSNPVHKKVPVLIHGDKSIPESLIIVDYIDQVWGSSSTGILPSDAYDRAVARFWGAYVDDKLVTSLHDLRGAEGEAKAEAAQRLNEYLTLLEEAFIKRSQGKTYFGGDNIGYVDIAFGSILGWLKAAEKVHGVTLLDEKKIPKLVGWSKTFLAHEGVKDVVPEAEKLVEISKMFQAMEKAKAQERVR